MLFKKKKVQELKYFMLQEGLSNFLNDSCIKIIFDEENKTLTFVDERKNGSTATLPIDKITSIQMGTRNKLVDKSNAGATIVGSLVAGTTGAIVGANIGNKSNQLATLTINYKSTDTENKIILYQTNYGNTNNIQLLKAMLDKYMLQNNDSTHIDL